MFQPNSIKGLRAMSASNKSGASQALLNEINTTIKGIQEWRITEQNDFKSQLAQNKQENQTTFKSGYEIDDDDDQIGDDARQREHEIYQQVNQLKKQLLNLYGSVPSYMGSQYKTNEVNQQLQQSLKRYENVPKQQLNIDDPHCEGDIIDQLNAWKQSISQLEEYDLHQTTMVQMDISDLKQQEHQIEQNNQNNILINSNIKADLVSMEQDLDEIDQMLKDCGIN